MCMAGVSLRFWSLRFEAGNQLMKRFAHCRHYPAARTRKHVLMSPRYIEYIYTPVPSVNSVTGWHKGSLQFWWTRVQADIQLTKRFVDSWKRLVFDVTEESASFVTLSQLLLIRHKHGDKQPGDFEAVTLSIFSWAMLLAWRIETWLGTGCRFGS